MDVQSICQRAVSRLKSLQVATGLFRASSATVTTGYDKAWVRDTIYEAIGLEAAGEIDCAIHAYQGLLDVMIKHRHKIEHAINNKPAHGWQYIHARFHPLTLEEFHEGWGNRQNDSIGLFLFKVGDLMEKGATILRDQNDWDMIQLLVAYLQSVQYWRDEDNGVWEEREELHASSVGLCVAGLMKISSYAVVPEELIEAGKHSLNMLLPRESFTKRCDLALLALIWPCNIVTSHQAKQILLNVETVLLKERGVIRYEGDVYYGRGGEAEWCFGFPWLALIYRDDPVKYFHYLSKSLSVLTPQGDMPELYYSGSTEYNENTPLGWGLALLICSIKV